MGSRLTDDRLSRAGEQAARAMEQLAKVLRQIRDDDQKVREEDLQAAVLDALFLIDRNLFSQGANEALARIVGWVEQATEEEVSAFGRRLGWIAP